MSFSFTANGATKEQATQLIDDQRASNPNLPQAFADAVKEQIAGLPDQVAINLSCYGHSGWGDKQVSGELSLHFAAQVVTRPNG